LGARIDFYIYLPYLSPEELITCLRTIPHLLIALYLRSWNGYMMPGTPTPMAAPCPGTIPGVVDFTGLTTPPIGSNFWRLFLKDYFSFSFPLDPMLFSESK